jgi:hypothetical protein
MTQIQDNITPAHISLQIQRRNNPKCTQFAYYVCIAVGDPIIKREGLGFH